jgi:hypothetical protein
MTLKLSEIATIVRSKNAGPFRLTFDIMLPDRAAFDRVKKSNKISNSYLAQVFQVPVERISSVFAVPAANAFKVTLVRDAQCSFGESDVYGCQQHAPLMDIDIE